jgi:signal transduction histidine kinase
VRSLNAHSLIRPSRSSSSLNRRFVAWVLLGELAFALVIGGTVGLYGFRLTAAERLTSLERVGRTVMASVMPLIAEGDMERIDAQMKSVLLSADAGDILFIAVLDGQGNVITQWDTAPADAPDESSHTTWAVFTEPQVIEATSMIEGVRIGSVQMGFAPPEWGPSTWANFVAAMIVVFSVALVSAPWTAWLVLATVVEPLEELRDGAEHLAAGDRNVVLYDGRRDEIGQLAAAFDHLTHELVEKEGRLADSRAELEESFEALAIAKRDLEKLDQMKSDFVAVASHELRTPLSVVRLYAEMLEEQELGNLSEESREAVRSIGAAASRLSSIVCDLMDAALLERGLLPLDFARVSVDEIVREAARDGDQLARPRGITVVLEEPVPEVETVADPLRVRQMLDNLLSNAVKYSDGSSEVLVRMSFDGERAVIDVIDEGPGVPEERRRELFRLFGRLGSDDNRDCAGLGLGLAISSRIATAHGGSLTYAPGPDARGSRFSLTLPVRDHEDVEAAKTFRVAGEG